MEYRDVLNQLRAEHEQVRNAVVALEQLSDRRETAKILGSFAKERELIEDVILSVEKLLASRGKRRGKRPTWIADIKESKR